MGNGPVRGGERASSRKGVPPRTSPEVPMPGPVVVEIEEEGGRVVDGSPERPLGRGGSFEP